ISCPRPSSSSRKSSLVRSLTMAPVLLRTLANRLTTLTPVENVGLVCSCCCALCCAPSRRRAGRRPRTENRLGREMDSPNAIGVMRDARNGGGVTCKMAIGGADPLVLGPPLGTDAHVPLPGQRISILLGASRPTGASAADRGAAPTNPTFRRGGWSRWLRGGCHPPLRGRGANPDRRPCGAGRH